MRQYSLIRRGTRLRDLFSKRYAYLRLLLFWPLYGLAFCLVEQLNPSTESYTVIHCFVDDLIPFCEWFVIPYCGWYVFLAGMVVYLLFFDVPDFRRYMHFIILTYSFTVLLYILFPNGQNMRPLIIPRYNLLTRTVRELYHADTNTNVCPSLHVIGSIAVLFASFHTERFRSPGWRCFFWVSTIAICVSVLFMKQHSFLDLLAGIVVSLLAYPICYHDVLSKKHCDTHT